MILYTCTVCRYTFPAEALPDRCSDCGKEMSATAAPAVREATEAEAAEYEKVRKELAQES